MSALSLKILSLLRLDRLPRRRSIVIPAWLLLLLLLVLGEHFKSVSVVWIVHGVCNRIRVSFVHPSLLEEVLNLE